jgi:hypothetical protein
MRFNRKRFRPRSALIRCCFGSATPTNERTYDSLQVRSKQQLNSVSVKSTVAANTTKTQPNAITIRQTDHSAVRRRTASTNGRRVTTGRSTRDDGMHVIAHNIARYSGRSFACMYRLNGCCVHCMAVRRSCSRDRIFECRRSMLGIACPMHGLYARKRTHAVCVRACVRACEEDVRLCTRQ